MNICNKLSEIWYTLFHKTEIDKSDPIYEKPDITLFGKALFHEDQISKKCINPETGLLLYKNVPLEDDPNYDYTQVYDMADAPAWQAKYITGLAFKLACMPDEELKTKRLILKLLIGLENCLVATGKNVLCRSYMKYDGDEPLHWMKTYEEAKEKNELDQGWWQKGEKGFWFRGQCAPGHYQAVWTMACVMGHLQRFSKIPHGWGRDINLKMYNIISRLYATIEHDGDGDIVGVDGEITGFGDTDVYYFNPQFALWHLTRHLAAQFFSPVDVYKADERYNRCLEKYEFALKDSYYLLVPVLQKIPLNMRPLKANDIHWQHFAWLGVILGDHREEKKKNIQKGFKKLYKIHDPFNIHNFIIQKAGRPKLKDKKMNSYFMNAMRWYPLDKREFNPKQTEKIETNKFQPIENRDITSSYAKTDPCKKVIKVGERTNLLTCGFDYVLDYWMARYFNLLQY